MFEVDYANPLKKSFSFALAMIRCSAMTKLNTDPKVVPIKPLRRRLNPMRRISVSQLLFLPILAAGICFYTIARDRLVTRSDFVIRKAEDSGNEDGTSLGSLLGRTNQLSLKMLVFLRLICNLPRFSMI